jgi:hypothetical protein
MVVGAAARLTISEILSGKQDFSGQRQTER